MDLYEILNMNIIKRRALDICTFQFPNINNTTMVILRTSEVGATKAPINIIYAADMLCGNRACKNT
jgi:hypothetical protein